MTGNFFDYMYSTDQENEKLVADSAAIVDDVESDQKPETVAMDENIGEWTHKFVIYCKNPRREFEDEIKAKNGVVAVFKKTKKTSAVLPEYNPSSNR